MRIWSAALLAALLALACFAREAPAQEPTRPNITHPATVPFNVHPPKMTAAMKKQK